MQLLLPEDWLENKYYCLKGKMFQSVEGLVVSQEQIQNLTQSYYLLFILNSQAPYNTCQHNINLDVHANKVWCRISHSLIVRGWKNSEYGVYREFYQIHLQPIEIITQSWPHRKIKKKYRCKGYGLSYWKSEFLTTLWCDLTLKKPD